MNRIFRSCRGTPRTITDKVMAAALLPGTAIFIGAAQLTQATSASGGRLAILGDRDYYSSQGVNSTLDPLMTPYNVGESGVAYLPKPDEEFAVAMAAGTYVTGQELTIGALGRFVAAASGDTVIANFDQAGKTVTAGELADVVIANAYRKA